MKNIEHIKYTYKHRLIVLKLAEKYFEDNKELLERVKYHDIDKLFLYFYCSTYCLIVVGTILFKKLKI